ncbi:CapA family protein [Lactiplantibacillus modestisalitolerans]|uniref:CapA family protein n=1 Tax=Lactiplantibacillus modestisalitolerans TaxID=1457219 RepID=A0ABV5WT54_9LACO|nr:CapA family protein [Lactiplantibacillus modestisalitolerans]
MTPLKMQTIAEIVGGTWVVEPANVSDPVLHFALYTGELQKGIGPVNLLFAMSLDHWQKGTGNTGVYANTFKDNHAAVRTQQRHLKMAIVERPVPDSPVPQLLVSNAYEALQKLVVATAADYTGKSIAVTGSVGKSTTKTFIAALLGYLGSTSSSVGNHNSRTSVKIQALNHGQGAFNVFEIAGIALGYREANHETGGVAALLTLDLAVLTQVDAGQKGWSASKTADVKTRIAVNLKPDGHFLINGEIQNLAETQAFARRFTTNLLTYGLTPDNDYYGTITADGQLRVTRASRTIATVNATGLDHGTISDMVAALAAFDLMGGTATPAMMTAFGELCAQTTTHKVSQFVANNRTITVIDDTHNAELLSIKNFIDFAVAYPTKPNQRKIFIEGRVRDLRGFSYQTHLEVVQRLNEAQFDHFYLYGPEMDWVIPAADQGSFGGYYTTPRQVLRAIAAEPQQELVIFIKADSRASTIDQIGQTLRQHLDYQASTASSFAMTTAKPDQTAFARNGVGRLLVILEVLRRVVYGKLNLTDPVSITTDLAKDRSINKVGLTVGDRHSVYDLVTLAMVASAPDVVMNLAEFLFGSNRQAFHGVRQLASALDLNPASTTNVTGRPAKLPQKTTLADLEKIGAAYCQLPDEVFSLLSIQERVFKGRLYQKRAQLAKHGQVSGVLFTDWQEQNGLYFTRDQRGKHAVAFLNSPHAATADAYMAELVTAAPGAVRPQAPVETVTLTQPRLNILADTYFGEDYTRRRQRQHRVDGLQKFGYDHSFAKLRPFFAEGAYNIFNFEAVFAQGASPLDGLKPFVLDADAAPTLKALQTVGFNLALLGNNHANDYGPEALTATLAAFKRANMATLGAGVDRLASRKIIELQFEGQTIALLNGYWYRQQAENRFDFYARANYAGVNCLDGLLAEDIRTYKAAHPEATVIVNAHWGTDYGEIKPAQRQTAERLVLAGADLIIGHGPHRLQPIEYVGRTPVLYSIGNGVFNNNGEFKKRGVPPYAAVVRLDLAKRELYWCPIYADNQTTFWQPDFVNATDFDQIRQLNGPRFKTTQLENQVNAVVIPF